MSNFKSTTLLENGLTRHLYADGSFIDKQIVVDVEPTDEEKKRKGRAWRDQELAATDNIAQTPDFPNRDKYLTYRQALRDWPSTSDFPDKKPTLG